MLYTFHFIDNFIFFVLTFNFFSRTIKLENGLTALLISDPSRQFVPEELSSSEEESSGTDESSGLESDSGKSGGSDQHGTKKRGDSDEEKLVSCLHNIFHYLLDNN